MPFGNYRIRRNKKKKNKIYKNILQDKGKSINKNN